MGGGLTGTDALERSQASAEAEVGSIDSPIQECLTWIEVKACYDDPWATPITDCRVRIEIDGSVVTDGVRTKGLSAFGREDGQPIDDVRSQLGRYCQSGMVPGSAVITLVPEGDLALAKDIEKQIFSKLEAFEASMIELLRPWLDEWASHGWKSIPDSAIDGVRKGFDTWVKGEQEFWAEFGHKIESGELLREVKRVAGAIENFKREAARKVFEKSLEWLVNPAQFDSDLEEVKKAAGEAAGEVAEKVKKGIGEAQALLAGAGGLWDIRDQLMDLLRAFAEGDAAAIERALEALRDALASLPDDHKNEMGEYENIIKDIVQSSVDWAKGMIEMVRETEVVERVTQTVMAVVMIIPMNFWAEIIGVGVGFILPEVLITIVLIIISAFFAGATVPALLVRIKSIVSAFRVSLAIRAESVERGVKNVWKVLVGLFNDFSEICALIKRLAQARVRNIEEAIASGMERVVQLVRRSSKITEAQHARLLALVDEPSRLNRLLSLANDADQLERLLSMADDAAQLESFLAIAGGKSGAARLEDLMRMAGGPGQASRLTKLMNRAMASGVSSPAKFQQLAEYTDFLQYAAFRQRRGFLPLLAEPSAISELGFSGANMKHFIERHTWEYLDIESGVGKTTTLWPRGTEPSQISSYLNEALLNLNPTKMLPLLPMPKSTDKGIYGKPLRTLVGNDIEVQVGVRSDGVIGQFFPTKANENGFITINKRDMDAIWQILKRP